MSTVDVTEGADQGFFSFYREYAHTGIHAASTAGLTAFGLLTFAHRGFVVLAIGVYILPPIYLYLTRDEDAVEPSGTESGGTGTADVAGSSDTAEPTPSAGAADSRPGGGSSAPADAPRPDEPSEASDAADPVSEDRSPDAAAVESTAASETEPGSGSEEPVASGSTDAGSDERSRTRTEASTRSEPSDSGADADIDVESGSTSDPRAGEAGVGAPTDGESMDEESADGESTDEVPTDGEPMPLEWVEVDSPTDGTLSDVVAAGSDAYAVGAGGAVLARQGTGNWETVLDHGPAAESNALVGVDTTDDGEAVWFAGDSGALGRYDVDAGRHTDRSAPAGITDNWMDVAVSGLDGEERVYLVNGSGQVLAGEVDGGEVDWTDPIKPGSGSSMSAIAFLEGTTGYCCDTNSGVYETTDGESFDRIGIEGGGAFTALAAADRESLAVADDDGTIQRYDGSIWTPLRAAEVALDALATDGSDWFAVGDGGTIRELVDGDWEPCETPVETDLNGVAVGDPSVAVGADGTLLELRPPDDE